MWKVPSLSLRNLAAAMQSRADGGKPQVRAHQQDGAPENRKTSDDYRRESRRGLARLARLNGSRPSSPAPGATRAPSPDTDLYANIDHPQWEKLGPELHAYARARMKHKTAQITHFGKEHQAKQGGVCYGTSSVWLQLHHARPQTHPADRMAALMSEAGSAHALVAQRMYNANVDDVYNHPTPASNALLKQGEAVLDAEVMNRSSMFGEKVSLFDKLLYTSERRFEALGNMLEKMPGYYTLPIYMRTGQGHALNVHSNGNGQLTVFDSNVGELEMPAADFARFMKGLKDFYRETRGLEIAKIQGVQRIEFSTSIDDTPLAGLIAAHS
jgi:hypothetical protein